MGALKTGGQGSVYKAKRQGAIITAVKLMPTPVHSEDTADKNYIDFSNEVAKLKKVNEQPNPNVVKILGSGITDTGGFPFIEMEFIEGPDLEELLQPPREALFTIKEAIKVADQLSHALAHCHRVDVKHGDIKSNNVKFNIHTGNYVLLDFGLALMSDEQRRTSLRQAGAVEFMAPEQNEEMMLFQTDVYSFGIILYELLAGTVPFPLRDKGETARNAVKLAHMETAPPDLLELRRKNLPQAWPQEKKEREMHVPYWLISMIYKCLEKRPENRFTNGMELNDYLVLNSTLVASKTEITSSQLSSLQAENDRLLREKDQLQALLVQYQQAAGEKEKEIGSLRTSIADRDRQLQVLNDRNFRPYQTPPVRKGVHPLLFVLLLLLTIALGVFAAYKLLSPASSGNARPQPQDHTIAQTIPKTVIGRYKVAADRAYFHNEADESTRRTAYMVPSVEIIDAYEERNGFIYTEFTNRKGKTSKGWLRLKDMITVEEWEQRQLDPEPAPQLTKIEINNMLQQARAFMESNNREAALDIYKTLSAEEVPEAMYHYGNMGLLGRNEFVDCATALDLVRKSSNAGYTEAKRTLGFLYLFADNNDVIEFRNYERCSYEKNVIKGTQLLVEAIAAGDSTSNRILEDFRSIGSN
jgi:serine/threonine-protein kinase